VLDLGLNLPGGRPPRLLFIGAHSDDIEIGCGGTVIQLLRRYPDALVHWVVLSSEGNREQEAQLAARTLLADAREPLITIETFRGAYFPTEAAAIKDFFEEIKSGPAPDVIFSHCRDDLHQDHRIVGELTWNTFRDHVILEYEIPKYDGGLGSPSVFVPLSDATVRRKIDLLMSAFETQHDKRWFTPETFLGLMRLRGIECNAPDGYAEAFYSRKLVLGTG
jgi:LmbE family N-acetylglucosaminyl deacetylase